MGGGGESLPEVGRFPSFDVVRSRDVCSSNGMVVGLWCCGVRRGNGAGGGERVSAR
jgi:hypothetical protein